MNQTVKMILAGVAGLGIGAILHRVLSKPSVDSIRVLQMTMKVSGDDFLDQLQWKLREPASKE